MLSRNGKVNGNGNFNWVDAIIDSAIVAGLAFFSTLLGLMSQGAIGTKECITAGITASIQFFTFMAIKRGLKKAE